MLTYRDISQKGASVSWDKWSTHTFQTLML